MSRHCPTPPKMTGAQLGTLNKLVLKFQSDWIMFRGRNPADNIAADRHGDFNNSMKFC